MTGTSLDGIDVARIETTGRGTSLQATVTSHEHAALGDVSTVLRALADGEAMNAATIACAATSLGQAIAQAVQIADVDWSTVTCIAVHGQTVHHRPPHTWQLLDPSPIVAATGVPVVTGQRYGDLVCGGQGAPLTPLSDWVLYRHLAPCIVVNLGGFANATVLPTSGSLHDVRGLDLCPCNHLLDTFARRRLQAPFDVDGASAQRGTIDVALAKAMADDLLNATAMTAAMGEEDRQLALLNQIDDIPLDDAAATLAAALGQVIGTKAAALGDGPLAIAGGSVHHGPLMAAIERAAQRPTAPLPGHGAREAAAMAVLALLELDGVPASLEAVTGRRRGMVPGGLWMHPIPPAPPD